MRAATIAVTGVAGPLGQRLLAHLDRSGSVARVVGFDLVEPPRRTPALEVHRLDLAAGSLRPWLDGVDVLVHLAGPRARVPGAPRARSDTEGTRRLLEAASSAGVRRIVRASSTAVYGAWPTNPVPLTEDAPLRPAPGFLPALHDAEVERLLDDWATTQPGSQATVLRFAPVVGLGPLGLLARCASARAPLRVRDAGPPAQVVHVDDAATALALCLDRPGLRGPLNVAADGWLAADVLRELVGTTGPALPAPLVRALLDVSWRTGSGEVPPSVLPYLVHPWVVANDRMRATGWVPRHTNEEAILAAVGAGRSRPGRWFARRARASGERRISRRGARRATRPTPG